MEHGIHFISGLPRSGSTLLAGILSQNPRFHAGMSSPVARLFTAVLVQTGAQQDDTVFVDDDQRREMIRGLVTGYYHQVHKRKIVFDTNRIWCSKMAALAAVFPHSRVIACARNVAWIIDSFERLFNRSPLLMSRMFSPSTGANLHSRIDVMAGALGVVGFGYNALQEAFHGEYASRLIVIDYEALAREPERTMGRLYELLGLPPFAHDFDSVVYDAEAFDQRLGVRGLHKVGRKVQYVERETILPPVVFERYANRAFWRKAEVNRRGATVLLPSNAARAPQSHSASPPMTPAELRADHA
jgi:sulfotransferase